MQENPQTFQAVQHKATILLKMEPGDQDAGGADLGLSLTEHNFHLNRDALDSIRVGDELQFNATIASMGDQHHVLHMHAFQLERTGGHKDVSAHIHAGARYKFKKNNAPVE